MVSLIVSHRQILSQPAQELDIIVFLLFFIDFTCTENVFLRNEGVDNLIKTILLGVTWSRKLIKSMLLKITK